VIVWSLGWGALTMAVAKLGKRVRILPFSWRGVALHVVAALGFAFVHHLWWAVQVALRPYDGMGAQTFRSSASIGLLVE
jgi:hypothetical protein